MTQLTEILVCRRCGKVGEYTYTQPMHWLIHDKPPYCPLCQHMLNQKAVLLRGIELARANLDAVARGWGIE